MVNYNSKNPNVFRTTERREGYITGIQDGMTFSENKEGVRVIERIPVQNDFYRTNPESYKRKESSF